MYVYNRFLVYPSSISCGSSNTRRALSCLSLSFCNCWAEQSFRSTETLHQVASLPDNDTTLKNRQRSDTPIAYRNFSHPPHVTCHFPPGRANPSNYRTSTPLFGSVTLLPGMTPRSLVNQLLLLLKTCLFHCCYQQLRIKALGNGYAVWRHIYVTVIFTRMKSSEKIPLNRSVRGFLPP